MNKRFSEQRFLFQTVIDDESESSGFGLFSFPTALSQNK